MEQTLAIPISSWSLLKYALPTIFSNIFMNIYSLVDSLFVANYISTDALFCSQYCRSVSCHSSCSRYHDCNSRKR